LKPEGLAVLTEHLKGVLEPVVSKATKKMVSKAAANLE
jgi:hypothetical protein